MADKIDSVLDTLRATMRVETLAGATVDDTAGALLELGAEMSIAEYGAKQTADLFRRLADTLEAGTCP